MCRLSWYVLVDDKTVIWVDYMSDLSKLFWPYILNTVLPISIFIFLVSRCSNSWQIWCGVYGFALSVFGYADGEDWPAATLEERPGGGRRRPQDGQDVLQCSRAKQSSGAASFHTHTHALTHAHTFATHFSHIKNKNPLTMHKYDETKNTIYSHRSI